MGTLIGWIITGLIGFVAGWLAQAIVPGDEGLSWWQTALLGVVGAFVGGILLDVVFGWDVGRFVGGVVGALVLLMGYNLLTRRKLTSG